MRILHVISQYPGKTGSGTYLQALIREASKKNFDQGLVGARQKGLEYQNSSLEYIDMVNFDSEEIPFPIIGMSDKMPYKSSIFHKMTLDEISRWEKEFTIKFEKAIKEFKPDIILSNHLWLATSIAAELSEGIPVYGICHGTDIRQFHKLPWIGERVIKGLKKLEKVFALTLDQKATIERIYGISGEKMVVVGGGFDEEVFNGLKANRPSDKTSLIYAGKISYAKGLLPLLQAYEDLSKKHSLELIIVGSGHGPENDEIIKKGSSLGVKFTGAVSQVELAELFKKSHIFVLPSYYEGLPLVIMEALACELRIVTTDIPGLRGYIGKDLTASGIIQFVNLPRMIDLDTPFKEDYSSFIEELKKNIEKQIKNTNDGYNNFAPFKREVERLSWEGVFNRISNSF